MPTKYTPGQIVYLIPTDHWDLLAEVRDVEVMQNWGTGPLVRDDNNCENNGYAWVSHTNVYAKKADAVAELNRRRSAEEAQFEDWFDYLTIAASEFDTTEV